jgi:transcriptional regulator of aromatic amino acid metabolism
METAIAQFTYLPATKAERETFVQMCVDEITSGERNPLQLEIMLKNLEETVNAIRKHPDVKEAIQAEAEKYTEKTFKVFGCSVTKTQRTSYDFTQCSDSVWEKLNTQKQSVAEQLKERENFLKNIKPGMGIADTETGEVINPPHTSTSEFLTIKLP